MDIQTRSHEVEGKLCPCRAVGFFAFAGLALLYAALLVPVIEARPVMAFCVTLAMACMVPFLMRWHAWTVEHRVLAKIAQDKG